MEIFNVESYDELDVKVHTEINESDGGKEYFHIVTRRSNGRYNGTSFASGRRGKKRGRKPKIKNPEIDAVCEARQVRIKARETPSLMVNERERRKTSDRFNTFLEVLKGEKEFYIEDEGNIVEKGSIGGGSEKPDDHKRGNDEIIPTHHIFADGHLSVLTESIDELSERTCVIHVKENTGYDSVENSLLASIEDGTGTSGALSTVMQEILNIPSSESAQLLNGIEQFGEKPEILMNVMKEEDDLLKSEVDAYIDLKDFGIDIEESLLEITESENLKTFQISETATEPNVQTYSKAECNAIDTHNTYNIPNDLTGNFPKVKSITVNGEDKKFRCKLCSMTFSTYADARSHAKSYHSSTVFEATTNKRCEEGFFKCPECEREFPTEKGRNKHHLLMHLKNKPVNCPHCSQVFNSFRPLERHLKEIHDKNAVNFCDICEEEFVLGTSLEHHITISHPSNSKFNMLDYYSKQVITPKRIIHCPLCDEKLIGAKSFRIHHEKVHNGQPFTCKQCKFKTYSASVLKRHLATVHKAIELSLYTCAHCKMGYQMPQDLEEHYINVHNKEPSNLCPYCGEKFACLEMLRFHKGKHRAFPCDFCPLGFMKPEALDEHLNTVHKNDLSKEADTLFDIQPSTSNNSELVETSVKESESFISSPEKDAPSKILEIDHDGSVKVKEEPNILSESDNEFENETSANAENKVHHLHHTKEGDLKEMDMNNPLKGFRIKDLPKKINCPICSKLLTTKFLRTHMRSHQGSLPHKCPKCSKAYAQGTLLRKHMKNRHYEDFLKLGNKMPKKKKVQCEYCELVFEDIYLLEDHLWTHLNEKTYKCETCRIKFGMKVNWMEHYKTHYFKEEKKCPNCERTFKSVGFYREHIERCLSNWTCEECGFKCESPEMYRKHKKIEHTSGASLYQCPHCEKSFYSKYGYEDHLITHSSVKQFLCQYCNKEFKRRRPLMEHIARVHVSTKHICNYCSLSFETPSELHIHSREHRRQQMVCTECGIVYLSRQTLDNHTAVYHNVLDQDPFICGICSEIFEKQIDLKLHLPKHSPDSPYICQVHRCHKMFRKEVLLRSHMARRHSYLEYFCHYCDRKFILDSDLRKHISIHKGNLEYKCGKCEFKCPNKIELYYHICNVDEEPYYECRICGVKNFKRDNMVSHVQMHHKQSNPLDFILSNKWKCSVCDKLFNSQSAINKHLEQHAVHGVLAPGTIIKALLSSSVSFKNENPPVNSNNLNLEDLLSLLKVDVITQSENNETGDQIKLASSTWHCSACSFISNTEISMKNHIISSATCLQKLEEILLSKGGDENQLELKVFNEADNENFSDYQSENASNFQYLLVENNETGESSGVSKESVLLMDNNLQLVLNGEGGLSNLFTQSNETSSNLPVFEISNDEMPTDQVPKDYEQEFPIEVSPELLASSGVLIQMEDGRLVIPDVGTGNGVLQYQLVKEETNNQGTTESTYEILENAVNVSDSAFVDENQAFIMA